MFSGESHDTSETSPLDPRTEYGRQKRLAERQLSLLGPQLSILRLTKVLCAETPLLRQWHAAWEKGQTIYPFSELLLAPVSLPYAVSALMQIGRARQNGTFHLSGARDLSYAELALLYARALGVSAQAIAARSSQGVDLVYRPHHAALKMDATAAATDIRAQTIL